MNNREIEEKMVEVVKDYYEKEKLNDTLAYREASEENYKAVSNLKFSKEGRSIDEMIDILNRDVFPYRVVGDHPRDFAFIPAPVEEISKIGDVLTTLYNPNAAGWFSAPVIASIENLLIDFLCEKVGFGKESGGTFVSGGSLSNLTAIVAARDDKLEMDNINKGVAYISNQAHHSVNKGLRIVGIPDSRIRSVKTDENLKMIPAELEKLILEDRKNGLIPFMVIGSAGTTNTGTIDPLFDLAQVCQRQNVWFHVDGAFGGSLLLSDTYSKRLRGIEFANSVTWDAHKWLFQTYTCAMVLVRDKKTLLKSFSDNPSYLKDAHNEEQIESWDLGPELSRPALSVKLWLTLQTLGLDEFERRIDHSVKIGEKAESELKKYDHWQIVTHGEQAILTFRYYSNKKSEEELDTINTEISHSIVNSGFAVILTTEIKDMKVLRMCTISPKTTNEDIEEVVEKLNECVESLKL